jgi:hypothetical protein
MTVVDIVLAGGARRKMVELSSDAKRVGMFGVLWIL